ncbi:MAG: exosome complex RNA-binding protein Csl4 [Nitrososphaerota archaeon]
MAVPGDKLCVIEEYVPGLGTKALDDGRVYASVFGVVEYDRVNRDVRVKPIRQPESISKGERLLAFVKDVQDKIAVASAIARLGGRPLRYPRTGVILARRGEMLDNVVGVGDLILVTVSSIFNGMITFDISPPGCGCILAVCSRCGSTLEKRGNILECLRCGNRERRKLVLKYGDMEYYARELVSWLESKGY